VWSRSSECSIRMDVPNSVTELARKTEEVRILQRVSADINSTLDLMRSATSRCERWTSCSSSTTRSSSFSSLTTRR
jgi:hypothetical protein